MTGKKVTIMLEEDLDKKLRELQSKAIRSTNSSVSFSRIINELVRNYLKK